MAAGGEFAARELAPLPGVSADFYRRHAAYQEVLRRVAAAAKIELADAEAAFAKQGGEALFGPQDAVHPSPAGARVVAATIHERLSELGWLRRPPLAGDLADTQESARHEQPRTSARLIEAAARKRGKVAPLRLREISHLPGS